MTREEATFGAIVVRLDRHGERMDPRVLRVLEIRAGAKLRYVYSGRMLGWIALSRLRLASDDEKRKAGL